MCSHLSDVIGMTDSSNNDPNVSSTRSCFGWDMCYVYRTIVCRREYCFPCPTQSGQPLTWQRSMKEITKRLGAVGATRIPGWRPRDPHLSWLETPQDMVVNRCECRSCCQFLSRLPDPYPVHLHSFLHNKASNKSWLYGSEASVLDTDVMLSMMMTMMVMMMMMMMNLFVDRDVKNSTGSVLNLPGKGRKSLGDERAPIVQNAVEQLQSQSTMASSSITQVSQLTGIPRVSMHRIMRRHLHLYPSYSTLLQKIAQEDKEQRVTFTNWLLDNEEIFPTFYRAMKQIFLWME
ncbi:hypothetical protein T265_06619 [Opisthorchis viverrini]|uniref:Uncharacterized protein n=1 Tax=Opisthorchis viverrini TaxID=6198 RepID=A0A074ZRR9_OPIVI|nr:hypothetical protein T265_06619 [Opisthorchis viverrini]KER26040.1 hypothetical protein T265_06619 [Opisthorchis viverrini]